MYLELNKNLDIEQVRKKLLLDYSTRVVATSGCIRITFSSVSLKDIPTLFENIYNGCKNEPNLTLCSPIVYKKSAYYLRGF